MVVLIPVALTLAAAKISSIVLAWVAYRQLLPADGHMRPCINSAMPALAGEACRQVQGALCLKSVLMVFKLQATKKQPAKGWLLVMQGLDLVASQIELTIAVSTHPLYCLTSRRINNGTRLKTEWTASNAEPSVIHALAETRVVFATSISQAAKAARNGLKFLVG